MALKTLIITTDGACSGNGQLEPAAGYAFSIEMEGSTHKSVQSGPIADEYPTNQRAEAYALLEALRHIVGVCRGLKPNAVGTHSTIDPKTLNLLVVTDSEWLIGAIWGGNKRNANTEILAEIDLQLAVFGSSEPFKVKGHPKPSQLRDQAFVAANPNVVRHNAVDKLAAAAAQKARETRELETAG